MASDKKTIMMSQDIFEKICDVVGISEDERKGMVSLSVHLATSEPVYYESKKEARIELSGE